MITDRFTQMVKTIPMKVFSAAEVARHFVNHSVLNNGPLADLLAINGGAFTSKFFQHVSKLMNIHNSFTTTYHPQANGLVERYKRKILAAIQTYVAKHPRDWYQYTDSLTYSYNCQSHTSTSITPFQLVLSKHPGTLPLNPYITD